MSSPAVRTFRFQRPAAPLAGTVPLTAAVPEASRATSRVRVITPPCVQATRPARERRVVRRRRGFTALTFATTESGRP